MEQAVGGGGESEVCLDLDLDLVLVLVENVWCCLWSVQVELWMSVFTPITRDLETGLVELNVPGR